MGHISSTVVREWVKFGRDMTSYLPLGVSAEMVQKINNLDF